MTHQSRHRTSAIAALLGVAALLAVPGALPAATCAAPVPDDDLAGREIYGSFMKAVDDAGLMEPCGGRTFCPYEVIPRSSTFEVPSRPWQGPGGKLAPLWRWSCVCRSPFWLP